MLDVDPAARPDRLQTLPSWLLNQARMLANQCVDAHFTGPTDRIDYAVLATVAQFGPLSQADIGRRLGIDRGDLVAVLNRLEAAALLAREQDPTDRRRNAVRLSAVGRRRLGVMDRQVAAAQAQLLAPLDEREQAVLVDLLARVVAHHRATL